MTKLSRLHVDAGPNGLGVILSQEAAEQTNIVAYASRILSNTERRHSQIKKETLAVTWAIQHNHVYLYGYIFTLHPDHLHLVRIIQNSKTAPSIRRERQLLRIQPYQFNIIHQKGENNSSYYLSRYPEINEKLNDEKVDEYVSFVIKNTVPKTMTIEEVEKNTQNDNIMCLLMKALIDDKNETWNHPQLTPFRKINRTRWRFQDGDVF
ncbi:hypothetical protein JTB14_027176 [Gonioctena quinquepunctata]|nr:hypothetical protein JTB14_027176 [Gonioctena quinquepunctata]